MEADREKAIAFLDSWRRRDEIRDLKLTSENQLYEPNSLEEIIDLFHFYHEMEFFVEKITRRVCLVRSGWIPTSGTVNYPYHIETFLSFGLRFIYKVTHGPFMDRRNWIAANAGTDMVTPIFEWWKPWDHEMPPLLYPVDKYDLHNIGAWVFGLPSTEQPNYGWITRVLDSPGTTDGAMFDRIMENNPREL
ncbi:uncharacterized protein KD926_005311 [Aspergillus affinis]|uniref:uncharacterized protein n=1 Tax=Aspergillus affinis TaxID=1070780 RepID=UPI0022FDD6AB|nr:uncharacterized protein KD926_005311 [Aspergillus affinis]KAI9042705.1 hypothetical protein KD926_005311 [Aspergillus affinis]